MLLRHFERTDSLQQAKPGGAEGMTEQNEQFFGAEKSKKATDQTIHAYLPNGSENTVIIVNTSVEGVVILG